MLTGFRRKGKQYSVTDKGYRLYARFWQIICPVRAVCFRFRKPAVYTAGKLGLLPVIRKALGRERHTT